MLKVPLNLAYFKRTLRPKYANTQSTPKAVFLDPAWDSSVDIYAGMALVKQTGQQVTVVGSTGDKVYGLAAFMEAPKLGITEISNNNGGVNAAACWVLGPDAEFTVDSPAFDATLTWTDGVLVSAYASGAKRGVLCPVGTAGALTQAFARVLSIDSTTTLTIGGLQGTV